MSRPSPEEGRDSATVARLVFHRVALTWWLSGIAVAMFLLHLGAHLTLHLPWVPSGAWGLMVRFNMDTEIAIPTWWAQIQLFLAAVTLALIARASDNYQKHWFALAVLFVILSVD